MNPHGVYHTPLKRARLPVPPPRHVFLKINCSIKTLKNQEAGKDDKDDFILGRVAVPGADIKDFKFKKLKDSSK